MATGVYAQLVHDEAWAARVVEALATGVGQDVDLDTLERQFDFAFAPQWVAASEGGDGGAWRDPYGSQALIGNVEASWSVLLNGVWRACVELPGLDPAETGPDTDRHVAGACNLLYHRLSGLLLCRDTSADELEISADLAVGCVAADACARARARASMRIEGVRALQQLCAAATHGRDDEVGAIVDHAHEALVSTLTAPPAVLCDELRGARVPVDALLALLRPSSRGAPMSGAARQLCVARWAARFGEAVSQACVTTLEALRPMTLEPDASARWCGVGVFPAHGPAVRAAIETGGVGAATPCPTPTHTHAAAGRVIAATATTDRVALVEVRVARVVRALLAQGALPRRRVRTELVLPLVMRFGSEASVERLRLRATIAMDPEMDVEAGAEAEAEAEAEAVGPGFPWLSEMARAAIERGKDPGFPAPLLRDFTVLVLVGQALRARPAPRYVAVKTTVDWLQMLPEPMGAARAMVAAHTRASLNQAVGFVFARVVELMADARGVEYRRLPASAPGSMGVCLDGADAAERLAESAEGHISSILGTPDCDPLRWTPSRSAHAHARRRATCAGESS